jgi:NAD-dependent deacetylase
MEIVIISGAGISAESGVPTFRGAQDSYWEQFDPMEYCTVEALEKNTQKVLAFYDSRRVALGGVEPCRAHHICKELESIFSSVKVITTNVDDLHERAGSLHITHLHGKLTEIIVGGEVKDIGYTAAKDSEWRPNVVLFGEDVPELPKAEKIVSQADVLVIVGTSMSVYPAAYLYMSAKPDTKIIYVDPKASQTLKVLAEYDHTVLDRIETLDKTATEGLQEIFDRYTF